MRHFSAQQLHDYLQQNESPPLLLDVREAWEFAHCAIENSTLIPMGQIQARLHELDPEREIVVICHHGIRSRQICHFLETQGYTDMINLDGGVEHWSTQVEPRMRRY